MRRMGKCPGSNEFSTFYFLEHPIDEAYLAGLRLEAYRSTMEPDDRDDRRRPPNRVRGTQETDVSDQIQAQLNHFLITEGRATPLATGVRTPVRPTVPGAARSYAD